MQFRVQGAARDTGAAVEMTVEAKDEAEAQAIANKSGILVASMTPVPPTPPRSPRPTSVSKITRYRNYCGRRSIIFQSALLGWTGFMFFVALGLMLSAAITPQREYPWESEQVEQDRKAGAFALGGVCCPLGTYLLLGIPLGIAAIATLESGKDKS